MQRSTLGILAGGGAAGVGHVAAKIVGQKMFLSDPSSTVGATLARNPWIGALVGGGVAAGVLYATKKKDAAIVAALTGAAVAVPGVISKVIGASFNAEEQAKLGAGGLGVAVAERGMNGAPSVELFSAPPQLALSGSSNAPGSSSFDTSYAPVFGGQGF